MTNFEFVVTGTYLQKSFVKQEFLRAVPRLVSIPRHTRILMMLHMFPFHTGRALLNN
jgi:hypothetical protein